MDYTLPVSSFDSLLLKLVNVLELSQRPEGTATHQARQALLQATNDFKDSLARARELADGLPGGELLIQEQDELIDMLQSLKEQKRQQLAAFSQKVFVTSKAGDSKMDLDSTASTPFLRGESVV
ncbi:hypothetical protein GLOTRDRAFT_113585 [Gloeophyllum trabeum ATCC 11539]|uniref:Mediator complex subunit 9 n=1 Tax=Gloeophyllum trabeum (strain ATCC 11539 / FP-39264 / Madison 617) TaxID=670483 RepID=S7S5B2_GLOTA|nr:uncharacterized protein GLOTRDRAFT_113585 [Gloeophyllum trabeum ATCC 11539]EPQ61149.1 hypothetical protein GLOTRDRAFT_113585 [Gloeophyllum trabeum ATCC 11539]